MRSSSSESEIVESMINFDHTQIGGYHCHLEQLEEWYSIPLTAFPSNTNTHILRIWTDRLLSMIRNNRRK